MAKLKSILKINGSLQGLTIYKLPGIEDPIVRLASGPTKEDIQTKPQYDVLRRNLSETGGRSTATSYLMRTFQLLKPLADPDTAGQLNRLLKAVQVGDTESEFGKRAVRFSQLPTVLNGFSLTRALPFDTVVRGALCCTLSKETLSASLEMPALLPRLTFFAPEGYAYCRLVATLGIAPDLFFGEPKYRPLGDYDACFAQSAHTEWFAAGSGTTAQTLHLSLPVTPPNEAFSLVLAVGVQLGVPGAGGVIEPVRKRVGSAKIVAAL
jgi:hypothetical protein